MMDNTINIVCMNDITNITDTTDVIYINGITLADIHIMNCRTTERILTAIINNINALKAKENSVYLTNIVYFSDCDRCAKQIFNKTLNNICDEFLKQNVILTIKWDPAVYCDLYFGSSYKSKIIDFTWRIE